MKIFDKTHKISKNFLYAASAYRRMIKDSPFDFSLDSLKEQYNFETHGIPVKNKNNGYAVGKKFLDVTLSAMIEDYKEGLFDKKELCDGSCFFIRRAIKSMPSSTFFCYR